MPDRESCCDLFERLLTEATAAVGPGYFDVPVDGGNAVNADPIYRERTYCYELYTQLRCRWPDVEQMPFTLTGELDKRSHPILAKRGLGKVPDLLVHTPGNMRDNLVVVEVKSAHGVSAASAAIDLQKLIAFVRPEPAGAGYERGIYLIYGDGGDPLGRVRRCAEGLDLTRLRLLWQPRASEVAVLSPWA